MTKPFRIISLILLQLLLLVSVSGAQEADCLCPSIEINKERFQRTAQRIMLEQGVDMSFLLRGYDGYNLRQEIKEINVQDSERDFYERLSLLGLLLYAKAEEEVMQVNPNIYLKSVNNDDALWRMVDQIRKGQYQSISKDDPIRRYVKDSKERIRKICPQAEPPMSIAPYVDEDSPILITDAIVINKKNYCFGFISHDPTIKVELQHKIGTARFNELFPAPAFILSAEMFRNVSPPVAQEYVYLVAHSWQGLGSVFSAQKFFPENYNGFIEGKDYARDTRQAHNKTGMPARNIYFMFQPGHIGQAMKPFFGRTGMKFLELIHRKMDANPRPDTMDCVAIEEQKQSLSCNTIDMRGSKSAYMIEQAL